jgi:hypothetical protein
VKVDQVLHPFQNQLEIKKQAPVYLYAIMDTYLNNVTNGYINLGRYLGSCVINVCFLRMRLSWRLDANVDDAENLKSEVGNTGLDLSAH